MRKETQPWRTEGKKQVQFEQKQKPHIFWKLQHKMYDSDQLS
jgi:hypothetical protein